MKIWSKNKIVENLISSDRTTKLNSLLKKGYDSEMITNLSESVLNDVISNEFKYIVEAIENFDTEIAPELESKTGLGIVLLVNGEKGKAKTVEELANCEALTLGDNNCYKVTSEGTEYDLYALPETDDMIDFVIDCLPDLIADKLDWEGFDSEQEAIEDIATNMSVDTINEWCNWPAVVENCKPIAHEVREAMTHTGLNEASTKNVSELEKEVAEIRKLSSEYGIKYFTDMPFTAFDNDPESIEVKYPEFFRIAKAFFKEMGLADPHNTDELDSEWYEDVDHHDWETMLKVCDKLIRKQGKGSEQVEKVYKDVVSGDMVDPAATEEVVEEGVDPFNEIDPIFDFEEPSPFDEPEFDPDRELTDEERLQAEMAWEDNTRRHNEAFVDGDKVILKDSQDIFEYLAQDGYNSEEDMLTLEAHLGTPCTVIDTLDSNGEKFVAVEFEDGYKLGLIPESCVEGLSEDLNEAGGDLGPWGKPKYISADDIRTGEGE